MNGRRVFARFFCAICGDDIDSEFPRQAPLGKAGAQVNVCEACATDRPREKFGPEVAYTGAGATLRAGEVSEALRRKLGDKAYERAMDRAKREGLGISPRVLQADLDIRAVRHETARRRRTGSSAKQRPPTARKRPSEV